jgi:hypothetical protein
MLHTFGQGEVAYRYYLNKNNMTLDPNDQTGKYCLLLGDPTHPEKKPTPMTICDKPLKCNLSVANNIVTVDIWGIKKNPERCNGENIVSPNTDLTNKQFFISFQRTKVLPYKKMIKMRFEGFNYGLITVPLKIRFALNVDSGKVKNNLLPLNAAASANLGLYLGYSIGKAYISYKGITNFAFSGGAFIGPSIVTLSAPGTPGSGNYGTVNNSNLFAQKVDSNSSVTLPAMSWGLCMIGSINTFGLVVCGGFDTPMGKGQNFWVYRWKPWIGIGVVASLPL